MKKNNICAVLMIAAVVLCVFTLAKLTRPFPPEHYLEKIWLMDYGEWGILPENQHVFFYITELTGGNIKGNFVIGNQDGNLYESEFWYNRGDFSGNIEDGVATCRFVRGPLDKWDEGLDVEATLTFEEGGRVGLQFKPSETDSRLVFHESYQSYRTYNLNDVQIIADYMESGEMLPIDTGYGEETFFFKTDGISEYGEIKPFAFLINKNQDIFVCFNLHTYGDDTHGNYIGDITAEDMDGDGRTDIAVTENYIGGTINTPMEHRQRLHIFYQQQNGVFNRDSSEEL